MLITFKEMQTRVQRRISNMDTSTSNANDLLPKIKDWINERYDRIIRYYSWKELIGKYSLQIVASQRDYCLQRDVGNIVSVIDTTNGRSIEEMAIQQYARDRQVILDTNGSIDQGDPTAYYLNGESLVQSTTGATAEKVSVESSSASDITPIVVHIVGKVSSVLTSEDIVLTGASAVQSTNTYDASQRLDVSIGSNDGSINNLNGKITVTGVTSSNVIAIIDKFSKSQTYKWIGVSPLPNSSGTQPTWDVYYTRMILPLVNDNDVPILDCCQEIVQGAYSDALREDGQENEANTAEQKYTMLIDELVASRNNPDTIEQFTPYSRQINVNTDFGRYLYVR